MSRGELTGSLLRQVRNTLAAQVHLLDSILTTGGQGYLSTAVDAVESSAWRGGRRAQRPARQLLRHELSFVSGKLAQVRIVASSRVTLGGKAGDVPVSVRNNLPHAVTVQVRASVSADDQVTIAPYKRLVTVPAKSQVTVRIPVRAAAAGSKTLTLWLTTPEGAALPGKPTTPDGDRDAFRHPGDRHHQRRARGVRALRRGPGDPPRRAAGRGRRRGGGRA